MKNFRYKKWFCEWDSENQQFNLYTPDEMEQPKGFRNIEFECGTPTMCMEFINCY